MGSEDIDPKQKPENWNISQNYLSRLEDIVKSGNMICDKYILENVVQEVRLFMIQFHHI